MTIIGKRPQTHPAFSSYSWWLPWEVISLCSSLFDSIFSMKPAMWDCLEWWHIELIDVWKLSPNTNAPAHPKGMHWEIIWRHLLREELCNSLRWLPWCLGIHSWLPAIAAVPTKNGNGTAASSDNFMESKERARRTLVRMVETRCHYPKNG